MKQLANLGIDIRPNSSIASISKTADDRVEIKLRRTDDSTESAGTQEDSSVVVDHVLVAIGAAPNVGLVSAEDLDRTSDFGAGGVKVDEHLHFGKNIFGAGDVISFPDKALDLQRRVEHYDHALASGKLAGLNMAEDSEPQAYNSLSMFWSDLGPKIGYEAVGLVDSSLTTVGIWAKGEAESTPEKASLDPTDVRTESIGQTSSRSEEPAPSSPAKPGNDAASPAPEYRKGLVLYVKDRKIVGILMFNLFNRISLARSVIKQRMTTEHLQDIVDIFNINEL
jgi:programmed cell death 8 (apoptosis-inducing factor)